MSEQAIWNTAMKWICNFGLFVFYQRPDTIVNFADESQKQIWYTVIMWLEVYLSQTQIDVILIK